jgi:hypothetical protein
MFKCLKVNNQIPTYERSWQDSRSGTSLTLGSGCELGTSGSRIKPIELSKLSQVF